MSPRQSTPPRFAARSELKAPIDLEGPNLDIVKAAREGFSELRGLRLSLIRDLLVVQARIELQSQLQLWFRCE